MLAESDLSEDQNKAIDRLFDFDESFLIAPTGAGKTVVFLTAAAALLKEGTISRVLVIAPLKVCQTAWATEAAKWAHLEGLEIAIATGAPIERETALFSSAKIVVINEENVPGLFNRYAVTDMSGAFPGYLGFDAIGIDETSKWKDSGGTRFAALRHKMRDFKWRVGMTAQPVGEDWVGLFAQTLLIDLGKRFGRSRDGYLRKHFYTTDYMGYDWEILPTHAEEIAAELADLVHVMPDYKDSLPPKNITLVPIDIGRAAMDLYNTMRIHSVVTVGEYKITAKNRAVLSGKLEQFANGFAYREENEEDDEGVAAKPYMRWGYEKESWIWTRSGEILDAGESVIVVYWYAADLEWLRHMFPDALELGAGADVPAVMEQWRGQTGEVMLLHPASAGHGIDGLQDTCHRQLWVAPIWGNDKCQQVMDRLWRRGQQHTVEIEILIATGTIDQVKWDTCSGKGEHYELFLAHLGPESSGQNLESGE